MMRWFLSLLFLLVASAAHAQITCPAPVGPGRVVGDISTGLSNSFSYYETGAQITAPRTWTLPPASTVNKFCMMIFSDQFGGISAANTVTIVAGTAQSGRQDTIDGVASVTMNTKYAVVFLQSDGSSKWVIANSTASLSAATDAVQFGADPTGVADSSAALTSIFALKGGQGVYFPAGTYRIGCGHRFVAASAVSLLGSGNAVIKQDAGCTMTGDFMSWTNFGDVKIEGITIDLNTPVTGSTQYAGLAFYVNGSNQKNGPQILNSAVLNLGTSTGGSYNIRITVSNSAASWTNPIISQSRFTKTNQAVGTAVDECIALGGTGGFDSASLGNIHYAMITSNLLIGCAIQIDGDNGIIADNDVSGWDYGTGIFTNANIPSPVVPTSAHDNLFVGNILHDSPSGYDASNTALACVENDAYRSTFIGNVMHDCGGEGFRNYGFGTAIQGGAIYNNAKTDTIVGNYQRAGVLAVYNPSWTPYQSQNLIINNVSIYDTAGTQLYGYADDTGILGPVSITGSITGATAAIHQTSLQGTLTGDVWQVYTPTLSCGSGAGTPTSAAATMRYQRQPFKTTFQLAVQITTNGACATELISSLPVAADPGTNSFDYSVGGINATNASGLVGLIPHGAPSTINIVKYDGTYPGANSTVLDVSGSYATAN